MMNQIHFGDSFCKFNIRKLIIHVSHIFFFKISKIFNKKGLSLQPEKGLVA